MTELLAPAGSFDSLAAALRNGADAVYFGVGSLNMRARGSANFTLEDLPKIVRLCHSCSVKCFLTLNTIIYDTELAEMKTLCDTAKHHGVDAVIAADFAVINYAKKIDLPVHISVQANVSNIEAVKFFAQYADLLVLARELSLRQIADICKTIEREQICGPSGKLLKIEVFVHGALCVAISGKCHMSLSAYNTAASRGDCFQNCRRAYKVTDLNSGNELVLDNEYVMSPKDLCTISFLDQIVKSNVALLKIEGRGRSADYVATVTGVYREALDCCLQGTFEKSKVNEWLERLDRVFNRGFWHGGYYLGENLDNWCGAGGNQAKINKVHIGKVTRFFNKIQVAEIKLEAGNLKIGQKVLFNGKTTGAVEQIVTAIRTNGEIVDEGVVGELVSIAVDSKVRINDQVYLLTERKFGE